MQEKEVLYFISQSEAPQKSISHHLDVTFYTLVPEVSLHNYTLLYTSTCIYIFIHMQAMISLLSKTYKLPYNDAVRHYVEHRVPLLSDQL